MRLRLFLLLAVPSAALLVLASVVVVERHRTYQDANQATAIATLAGAVADLDEALGKESISSAQFFLGDDSDTVRRIEVEADRADVDQRVAELEQALGADPRLNAGLLSAVAVITETLSYRDDVVTGRITPLQIADRYAHLRRELIDALGRRAAAANTKEGTLALNGLVELIESRSVHVDERLAVQLGILYEGWAPGQHTAVIRAIAVQDEMVGDRSQLALQSQELRIPPELLEIRERLTIDDEVPAVGQEEWLQASDRWLSVLDTAVDRRYSQLLDLFEAEERNAATARTVTAFAVGGALFLALLVTGHVSFRLVRRISTITDQAKRMAGGLQPDRTAPSVRGSDEIGQLASTFDDMNHRLTSAHRVRDLESAVLEGIALGDPLEENLERSARLLGTDPEGKPYYRFTSTDPRDGSAPINEPGTGKTPLWLLGINGAVVSAPRHSQSRTALGLALLAQSRADVNAKLAEQAMFDELTGLFNRRAILEYSDVHDHSDQPRSRTGFVFVDLDDFKRINDQLGHSIGDSVLIAQSHRLRTITEELGGLAGRLGGDEFLAVIPGLSDENELGQIANRIVSAMSEALSVRSTPIICAASAGAVLARVGVSAEELRHEADTALYEAKNGGRGIAVVASEALRLRVQASDELRAAFRDALRNGQLVPFFQPIWNQSGCRLAGLEALARWGRPGHGIVGPNVFLPVAEELGLLREVDELLFRRVCEQIASWRAAGFDVPPVHVNASSVRIDDPALVASTLSVLDACGCPPSQIVLEVTESGLMADLASSSNSLQALRDCGIRIAADDFGSGYSSLSYLKRLPVDLLKIDRQFVDRIDESKPNQAIVSAVQTMATALGMQTIGEGIERKEELAYLTSIGCQQVQGFLLGHPESPVETQALLEKATRHGREQEQAATERAQATLAAAAITESWRSNGVDAT